jgi:hypothetical protein
MCDRKYLPTLADLLDRLSINQIKEVKLPEHKEQYAKEIKDILHDIDLIISEGNLQLNSIILRAVVVLSQINLHIWVNEANCRNGVKDGNNLELTHGLNGIRSQAKNIIQKLTQDLRMDHKIDCLAVNFKDWEISW